MQGPLLSFNLTLTLPPGNHASHIPYNFLPPKIALRRLRILGPIRWGCGDVSFPRLSTDFKGLVLLSLFNLDIRSAEELALPQLEYLYLANYPGSVPLPTQGWNLPRLRHVYIRAIRSTTDFDTALNGLRRYASQLESLFLVEYFSQSGLPHDFWDSFTALQLLGLRAHVLDHSWSGWNITPPRSHPFRYLVCEDLHADPGALVARADFLSSIWTYHEEVALVMEISDSGGYYMIDVIKREGWRTRMTETDGVRPVRYRVII